MSSLRHYWITQWCDRIVKSYGGVRSFYFWDLCAEKFISPLTTVDSYVSVKCHEQILFYPTFSKTMIRVQGS